jgi:hypothetical protein
MQNETFVGCALLRILPGHFHSKLAVKLVVVIGKRIALCRLDCGLPFRYLPG